MDERRRLCSLVLESGWSLSAACRHVGVSRPTGRMWLTRAREKGIAQISELSRAPISRPTQTPQAVVEELLIVAKEFPDWGPRKLLACAFPENAPICQRTAARILAKAGHRVNDTPKPEALQRFERSESNELWQMDFKQFGPRKNPAHVLSVLDDSSRFCLSLRRVENQTLQAVQSALWDAFGDFGLPLAILSDNGPAFRCLNTWRWSKLDLWLMLLNVRSIHGRPYHPQTQGKVERFHGTLVKERVCPDNLDSFRDRYNWVRPHDSLGLQTPGKHYQPSSRPRPATWPVNEHPVGSVIRKTCSTGQFSYKGRRYKAGIALGNTSVAIVTLDGTPCLSYANQALCSLDEIQWN